MPGYLQGALRRPSEQKWAHRPLLHTRRANGKKVLRFEDSDTLKCKGPSFHSKTLQTAINAGGKAAQDAQAVHWHVPSSLVPCFFQFAPNFEPPLPVIFDDAEGWAPLP